jgi:hypothetical protein
MNPELTKLFAVTVLDPETKYLGTYLITIDAVDEADVLTQLHGTDHQRIRAIQCITKPDNQDN